MQNGFKELENVDYDRASVKLIRFRRLANVRCFPLHWHDRLEILRIDSGSMTVSCGSSDIECKAGDIVVINPKEVHSAIAGSEDVYYTCLMFELAPLVNNRYYGQNYIKPLLFRQMRFKNSLTDEKLNAVIDELDTLYEKSSPSASLMIEARLLDMLSILIERYINTDAAQESTDMRFTEVLDYVDTHFTDEMPISELAHKFGYNKSYFCRKFKMQTGITCIEYLSSLRLDYAAILLKGTTASISEIAEQCGYTDANYFSRCFKDKYGVSPGEWKKNK